MTRLDVAVRGGATYTTGMAPRITLTTDFGTRDPYVAQVKAELYARGPETLEVIDLTHEIEPQNVREAALFVRAAWPRFPPGTIHVVVVDPGVGSARRAVAVAHRGHWLLAPDNGVLSFLLDTGAARGLAADGGSEERCADGDGGDDRTVARARARGSAADVGIDQRVVVGRDECGVIAGGGSIVPDAATHAVAIDVPGLARLAGLGRISSTFHGRDVFAPAAALLARGFGLVQLGPVVDDLVRLPWPEPERASGSVRGEIVHVDRFGNLISNLPQTLLAAHSDGRGVSLRLRSGAACSFVGCYADAPADVPVALVGSSELIEVAVRNASAQSLTGARVGDSIWLDGV